MPSTDVLFTPLKLGDVTLPNRIFMSALTRDRAVDTIPTDLMLEYYVQRADAGLIVTEGALITRQGSEWQNAPGIWNEEQVQGWKKITNAVHAAGGHIYCQLWHGITSDGAIVGRASHPDAPQQILAGVPVYAPSAISARGGKFRFLPGAPGYVTPTELPDPWVIIKQFREAAVNAKAAGFDGVELHGANGYLIAQFLDNRVVQSFHFKLHFKLHCDFHYDDFGAILNKMGLRMRSKMRLKWATLKPPFRKFDIMG
ncbi:oye family NADH-dependent flavin oxidoreductase [Amanita muscaria]